MVLFPSWMGTLFEPHLILNVQGQWVHSESCPTNKLITFSVETPCSLKISRVSIYHCHAWFSKSKRTHGLFIILRTGQWAAEPWKHHRCRCTVELGGLCHNWSHIPCWQHFTHQSCCALSGWKRVCWMSCLYSSCLKTVINVWFRCLVWPVLYETVIRDGRRRFRSQSSSHHTFTRGRPSSLSTLS